MLSIPIDYYLNVGQLVVLYFVDADKIQSFVILLFSTVVVDYTTAQNLLSVYSTSHRMA